jgi:hypothetical protein
MSRLARRMQIAKVGEAPRFDPEQHFLETAVRGRTARKARAHLRRMEPIVLFTPRWGGVGRFIEDLALDLAVGEPAIGCRSVSFQPVAGRPLAEAWQFVQHVFQQVGQRGWSPRLPTSIADRRGFNWALEQALEEIHANVPHRVALLAHGAEHLPVQIIEDLTRAWTEYAIRHPEGRRATLLLAGSAAAPWLSVGDAPRVSLSDFGSAEAAAAIVGRAGPLPLRHLERVARFTGGVPGAVEQIGRAARAAGGLPSRPEELISALGPLADEMRGAVDIVAAHDHLADRLYELADGEARDAVPEVDQPLLLSGLARIVRRPEGDGTAIRAPAIAALLG